MIDRGAEDVQSPSVLPRYAWKIRRFCASIRIDWPSRYSAVDVTARTPHILIETNREAIPLGKYGEPAEVAVAVEGLLSRFSDHLTGSNIMHDGGFTRSY